MWFRMIIFYWLCFTMIFYDCLMIFYEHVFWWYLMMIYVLWYFMSVHWRNPYLHIISSSGVIHASACSPHDLRLSSGLPDQGRIRATSGPYLSHVRSKFGCCLVRRCTGVVCLSASLLIEQLFCLLFSFFSPLVFSSLYLHLFILASVIFIFSVCVCVCL